MNAPPAADRYEQTPSGWFRSCGRWGLKLPAISLGCWHNFGQPGAGFTEATWHDNCRALLRTAFDLGVTHFDLANNYGPPPGSAEERVGRLLREDFAGLRDELIISTKAGYRMWPGPYGEWGSRKYLLASLDQSLQRLGLDYVDIFYHHRPEKPGPGAAPLDESLGALDQAVRSGKALYAGISSYGGPLTDDAVRLSREQRLTIPVIHQPAYNMFQRWIEKELLPVTQRVGMGVIAFCPLAQGLLTDRYLGGIPADSRAGSTTGFLRPEHVTESALHKARQLNALARQRGQTLAQMALLWTLRLAGLTSALIGASRPEQVRENCQATRAQPLSDAELAQIDTVLGG